MLPGINLDRLLANKEDSMRSFNRAVLAAMLVLCALGAWPSALLAQSNVEGTVYTSPHFDYQIQWASPWFFIEEGTESGTDMLVLSDGVSNVFFSFAYDPYTDAATLVELLTTVGLEEYVTNVQPLTDALGNPVSGGDATHAWAGITGTSTFDDGSTAEVAFYFDAHALPGGISYLMAANAPLYFYDETTLQGWQALASTALVPPSQGTEAATVPDTQPTTVAEETPEPPSIKTAVPEPPATSPIAGSGPGEPAPAFAAGPWRVAVRAVDQGEAIDYLGLGFVEGSQWVVVYADITNWSAADAELDVSGMTLDTAGAPVAPDLANTQATAALLGLEPANGSSVSVPAGGSVRVALVYQLPLSESMRVLNLDGQQLPLDDAVGRQLDVTDLSTIATPPALQTGTVGTIPLKGSQVQFWVETSNGPIFITLAGVEMPADASCYEGSTDLLVTLGTLYGTNVFLEADPAVTEPDTYYVWIVDEQGNRALLNQTLVANGLVIEGDLPEAARFGAWIEQTESLAQADGIGLWSTCAGQL
jgi:hypothetical protein